MNKVCKGSQVGGAVFCHLFFDSVVLKIAEVWLCEVPLKVKLPVFLNGMYVTLRYPGGKLRVKGGGCSLFSSAAQIFY